MTHRNWTRLSNMTHRNRTFLFNMTLTYIWLKELNLFLSMTQRIELFSWLKELNFFQNDSKILLKTTQRIKPFFEYDPKNRTSFYRKYVLRIVFQYDSHNWTYFSALLKEWNIWVWLKELNFLWYDSHNWTLKNSKNWFSQRQELNFFWKTWLKEFFRYDFFRKNQRIEPLFSHITQRIELFSRRWLKELNPSYKTQRLEIFFYMTQRLQPFEHDSMNWASSLHDSKNWTFFWEFDSMDWTLCSKGLKELDTKRLFDSNNQTFLFLTWGIGPFFFSCWLKELNFFSKISLKNYWPFLTWLTELNSVLEHDSPNWTFFFLKNMTHRNWTLLFNMSQRKWLHFWSWLKEYFFLNIWLKRTMILYFWK